MLYTYGLLLASVVLALLAQNDTKPYTKDGITVNRSVTGVNLWLIALMVLLVLFAGLRTTLNDTNSYMLEFQGINGTIDALRYIEWALDERPLFTAYQIILKTYVSKSPQAFLFVSALLTEISMVYYLYRYSKHFAASVFLFIAFTQYAFTMAAIKQTMATAIAIWSIPAFVRKKLVRAVVLIAIAMLVHPYSIVFGVGFFLCNRGVWNNTIYLALFLTVLASFFFSRFVAGVLSFSGSIGDEYDSSWLGSGTGVNRLRVVAYAMIPILSYFVRNESPENPDAFQDAFMNLAVIAACMSFLSGFGGSVLLGRMPSFFGLFTCLAFAHLMQERAYFKSNKDLVAVVMIAAFLVFYTRFYDKYYVLEIEPWTADIYAHTTLSQLINNW